MLLVLLMSALGAAPADDLQLTERLGHNWRRETVVLALSPAQEREVQAGRALYGPDGKALPYQLLAGATTHRARVAFQTDLLPYETRVFRFGAEPAVTAGDLTVEETPETITLAGSQTGCRIARTLANGQGPLHAVRLSSGAWAGGSRLLTDQPVTAYAATVTARGPVFAEVVCRAMIGNAATWELRLRLYAQEPVILVDETAAVDGPAVTFRLELQRDFHPDTLLYRSGRADPGIAYGQNLTWKLEAGEAYWLQAWLRWQQRQRQGNYCALFREDGPDLLAVAAREAGAWVDPTVPAARRAVPTLPLRHDTVAGTYLDFPLKIGQRKWMLMTLPAADVLAEIRDPKTVNRSPLPYHYLIKYGHFPLDMVKDYVLEWDTTRDSHPRLLITAKEVDAFLAANRNHAHYAVSTALASTQAAVRVFLQQDDLPLGSAPHMSSRRVIEAVQQADTALRAGQGTPEERRRLFAHLAFFGYTVARPEYWSPERGYSANPNMTTMVAGYQLALGSLLPSHPCAAAWSKMGLTELTNQLNSWSDDNGGWLEAPHYAMVSYDYIVAGFLMAHNSTGDTSIFLPKVRKVIDWFGKISTPPDSRLGGYRHMPHIGNTWLFETTGEFGVLARLWHERDPAFSAEMQWLFQQHRAPLHAGIGGSGHSSSSYRGMLIDPTLPARAPAYGSELFPKTGVILRHAFPSERETQLHMIAGTNHDHYDLDSGSVTVWGKGRIVADDFGYNSQAPVCDHSMLESELSGRIMQVTAFETTPRLDYVRGTAGGWTRQIAFVKDADPLGPSYFLIADSLSRPVPATWRLWCTAARIALQPRQALVVGKEDVDTDLFFLQPEAVAAKTEDKTCSTFGQKPDGSGGTIALTQTGVIVTLTDAAALSALLYPRLKTEAAPVVTALAGGKAARVQHAKGTDYLFLSPTPFTYAAEDIRFTGTAGALLRRGDKPILLLAAPGTLSAPGQEVTRGQDGTAAP